MEQCPTCSKEYSNKRGLVRYHFYDNPRHAPDSWETCPSCNKVFEELKDVRIHHKKAHDESIAHTEECAVCGEIFYCKPSHDRVTCSKDCQYEWVKSNTTDICPICNDKFTYKKSQNNTYCSVSCAGKARRDRLTVNCAGCGDSVTKKRHHIERVKNVYCDRECWKNSIRSDSFRNTQDEKKFRKEVFERDDYICQDCGERGGNINAHHIKRVSEYPRLATDIDNGTTLCVECHANRHESSGESNIARLIRSRYQL